MIRTSDPDLGGPKTYGSGSAALFNTMYRVLLPHPDPMIDVEVEFMTKYFWCTFNLFVVLSGSCFSL
jgi:hypothetical protein